MADNLKQLIENVDLVIPINGGVASVKTANHNPLEKEIISKVGKNTGLPFLAGRTPINGEVPNGSMFWNGYIMNNVNYFDIILSKKTLDGNEVARILDFYSEGSIIHFKDFVGRSIMLEYSNYIEEVTGSGQEYLVITVKGFEENIDYAYQVGEFESCIIEFLSGNKEKLDSIILDLEGKEDKVNKGIENGYVPLNNIAKIDYQYLDIVNDLVTGGNNSLLSAQQGLILKNKIDGINAILNSDDIDLDTLQEIVDAIKDVEGYLATILVNDLTTGGVTKALTAEMGKLLKQLIDSIYQPNVLVISATPTRSTNTFTYPALAYDALINKVRYKNPIAFVTTVGVAGTGLKRTDLVYITTNGIIEKKIGTESATVAIRPSLNSDEVAISFINVFDNVISDPTDVDNKISIQNELGVESFKISDYIRFENVTIVANEKKIRIDPLLANTAYISTSGIDATALLNNSQKPFRTLDAAIAAIRVKVITGLNWKIEFLTNGVFDVIDCNNFNFNIQTNLNVEIVFKKNSISSLYSIFKGENLTLTINFSTVTSTYTGLSISGTLDWDINTFKYIGSEVGITKLLRGVVFNGFVRAFIIKQFIVSESNFEYNSEILTVNNSNDYDFKIYNYNNLYGGRLIACTTSSFNTSWTIYNATLGGSATNLESGFAENILFKIGNINTSISLNISAKNVEFLNGSLKNITFLGLKKLKGKAKITYDTWNVSYYGRINLVPNNRSLGEFCLFEDVDLEFIQGASYPANNLSLIYFTNSSIKFKNTKFKVTGSNWNPPFMTSYVKDSNKGTLLYFEGDNDFNLKQLFLQYQDNPYTLPVDSSDLSTFVEATNRGLITLSSTMTVVDRSDFDITDIKKEGIDYPNSKKSTPVRIKTKNTIVNRVLDSNNHYIIDEKITLLSGEYIIVPPGGITISGNGFNVSGLSKNVAGQSIFISPTGGSGDFVTRDIVYNSGLGSVFNLTDVDGFHAIEMNDVNFKNCASLGKISGYRQFTGTTNGFYGCTDGLQLAGSWEGFKIVNSNVIGFSTGTFIKKDVDTIFYNRIYLDLNLSFDTGAKLCDFEESNFSGSELFQINNTLLKVAGVVDKTNTSLVIPNISVNNPKCRWTNSIGLELTAMPFQDLKSATKIWRYVPDDTTGELIATEI